LIDTHCHLNDIEAFPDVGPEIAEAARFGIDRMIVVGVQPDEWERTVHMTQQHEALFCILGWHPNYTANFDPAVLERLEKLLENPKVLALGEIGLDYHWDYSPKDAQFKALHAQLDLAERISKPVVFHAREAYSDLLDVLEARPVRPYLFHCFAGDQQDAKRAMALGAYFGVDGPITYKKSEELRSLVRSLPRERIVVETDAPYLSPMPFRGKQNRPAYVRNVAEGLAIALGISYAECETLTTENAQRFFGEQLG
jgi:TatD DNase family protein